MEAFVTVFDCNYLTRGYALYDSLRSNCRNDFKLYIICLDDEVYNTFEKLENVKAISIDDLVRAYYPLSQIKETRKYREFCWSLSAFSIKYVLEKYDVARCTYLDSDIMFYSDPSSILELIGDKEVLITPHNYSPQYDQSEKSGKFCVQFVVFKKNKKSMVILDYWCGKIIEDCRMDASEGKFGDQKYLDDWESRFEDLVYVCDDPGAGLAPWNCQKYELKIENDKYFIIDKITKIKRNLCFYHFHNLQRFNQNLWRFCGTYWIPLEYERLYKDYIEKVVGVRLNNKEYLYPMVEATRVCVCRFLPFPQQKEDNRIKINEIDDHNRVLVFEDNGNSGSFQLEYSVLPNGIIRISNVDIIERFSDKLDLIVWEIFTRENRLQNQDRLDAFCQIIKKAENHEKLRIEYICNEKEADIFSSKLCEKISAFHIPKVDTYILEKYIRKCD